MKGGAWLKRYYGGKIRRILRQASKALKDKGYRVTRIYEMHDADYVWGITLCPPAHPPHPDNQWTHDNDVDIRFSILDSKDSDGTPGCMNFSVDVTEVGGRMIGGLTPFNFTDRVWIPLTDHQEINERWQIMEDAGVDGLVGLITRNE